MSGAYLHGTSCPAASRIFVLWNRRDMKVTAASLLYTESEKVVCFESNEKLEEFLLTIGGQAAAL